MTKPAVKKHAVLSPSAAERWWNCPGSIKACENIPNPPTVYSAEGTVAHSLAEFVLSHGYEQEDQKLEPLIGTTRIQDGFEIEITEGMVDAVYEYCDYVYGVWEAAGRPPYVLEQKLEVPGVDASGGTPDAVMVVPFKEVHIFDMKFGQGKRVSAWENKQLMIYALAVMLKEDCPRFVLHIGQPRVQDGFTSYEGTMDDLIQFYVDLQNKAKAALAPDAPRIAGDWCKNSFCPARVDCPALQGLARDLIGKDFGAPAIVDTMPLEHILKVLRYEDTVKDWMAKVRDKAKELMLAGEQVPGYKVVQSFGHAKWLDEDVVRAEFEDEYGDKIYKPREIVSPAQFEKVVGKKTLGKDFRDEYTFRPENGYKIVEDDEKGEPVKTIKAEGDFND